MAVCVEQDVDLERLAPGVRWNAARIRSPVQPCGAFVGPGRRVKEDWCVFGGGSGTCRARLSSDNGTAQRARELEGREDGRAAPGRL